MHGRRIAQQLLGVHVAAVRGSRVQHRVRRVVQLQRHLASLRLSEHEGEVTRRLWLLSAAWGGTMLRNVSGQS